jgi:hypothetical protein
MSEEQAVELKGRAGKVMEWATGLTVATKDDKDQAIRHLAGVKGIRAAWVAYWKPLKEAAKAAHSAICDKEKEGTVLVDEAEAIVKGKVLAWDRAEAARIAEQQRMLDEAARKEREAQEAKARAQREKEDSARREEESARARAAQLEGEAKRKALEEADKASRAASAAAAKAEATELRAATVDAVQVVADTKTKGASTSVTWKAECTDLAALIAAAQPGTIAAAMLMFNQDAANAQAKSSQNKVAVPGVRFYPVENLSVRKAK